MYYIFNLMTVLVKCFTLKTGWQAVMCVLCLRVFALSCGQRQYLLKLLSQRFRNFFRQEIEFWTITNSVFVLYFNCGLNSISFHLCSGHLVLIVANTRKHTLDTQDVKWHLNTIWIICVFRLCYELKYKKETTKVKSELYKTSWLPVLRPSYG